MKNERLLSERLVYPKWYTLSATQSLGQGLKLFGLICVDMVVLGGDVADC